MSRADRLVVSDTVVVNYFLAVGNFELLRQLLGGIVRVPSAVFDPEEPDTVADEAVSELRAGMRLHARRAFDDRIPAVLRARSIRALPHFHTLPSLAADGHVVALELTPEELGQFARLRSSDYVREFSLVAGLGRGEAAALAIALGRGWGLATDDEDAIKVARALDPNVSIHRIRALLLEAVEAAMISRQEAQELHSAMIEAGFWDRKRLE